MNHTIDRAAIIFKRVISHICRAIMKTVPFCLILLLSVIIIFKCSNGSEPYEYLMYVEQWPKSVCYNFKCINPPPPVFTVHGLWPSNYTGASLNCSRSGTGTAFDKPLMNQPQQAALKAHLEQHSWPDVKSGKHMDFWAHEWSVHGKCSENVFPQTKYFEWCDEMWKQKPIGEILQRSSIIPGPNKYYTLSAIASAIKANTSHTPYIRCAAPMKGTKSSFLLFEVVICFDYYGKNIIDCTQASKTKCPQTGAAILYPN